MALVQCVECGREVSDRAASCVGCGNPISHPALTAAPAGARPIFKTAKSRGAYIVLGLFLGTLGIHNFYAGYNGRAVCQLLITLLLGWLVFPLIIVAIWAIAEIIAVDTDAAGDRMV